MSDTGKKVTIIVILICAFVFSVIYTILFNKYKCKTGIFHINSYIVCKDFGFNQNKCKVKLEYCGEDENFFDVKYEKDNQVIEFRINKNIVDAIDDIKYVTEN